VTERRRTRIWLAIGVALGCAPPRGTGTLDAAAEAPVALPATPDVAPVDAVDARGAAPAIFYVPHQDDDYLAMALGIAEHVAAGRAVKAILYTNGGNGGLRRRHGSGHVPVPIRGCLLASHSCV